MISEKFLYDFYLIFAFGKGPSIFRFRLTGQASCLIIYLSLWYWEQVVIYQKRAYSLLIMANMQTVAFFLWIKSELYYMGIKVLQFLAPSGSRLQQKARWADQVTRFLKNALIKLIFVLNNELILSNFRLWLGSLNLTWSWVSNNLTEIRLYQFSRMLEKNAVGLLSTPYSTMMQTPSHLR